MTRLRRRIAHESRAEHAWHVERDWQVQRMVNSGLGLRPKEWWIYESGRPDLAEGTVAEDLYGHLLSGVVRERTKERLRYLAEVGELRPSELAEINGGRDDFRHAW